MLIILDRDGVINHDSDDYIKSPTEWIPIEGSLEAIARLNKAGHKVVIATNQSGVGRGLYSEEMLAKIHAAMERALVHVGGHLDGIFYCPHRPEDHCSCRKPKPGMLLEIAERFPDEFNSAIFVGDSLRDMQAAEAVDLKAVLVKTGNGAATMAASEELDGIPIYENLSSFVDDFLAG
ncbi:D-glycero-beta-D-manno-heptose 1,7-bisphosphate 7-phosphatase [Candidiatus Paracoxiella cheracis]|uniref:D-glycero-beta-D-manno-heptose 1,7-bisphosphate 7-phosphatase n=1 Tax=Candidiatus Paracoxiella cheracis TaxID=3405120 RepID=UPI003BF57C3E